MFQQVIEKLQGFVVESQAEMAKIQPRYDELVEKEVESEDPLTTEEQDEYWDLTNRLDSLQFGLEDATEVLQLFQALPADPSVQELIDAFGRSFF